MAQVGQAYITVTPKLDQSGLSSSMPAAGKSAGSGFGGAFQVAAGNLIANAVTQIASAAADTFSKAFSNYANFEQLAGGVEKIFNEADISGIMQDAQDAYKDLNMSANEYLTSINQVGATFAQTMGDQKGYDTARTGMKAIADYASGTGRNIEELNDKFTMITRATSSYQSIADQFSGILPATSADFLKQAQAAGILSDEYTKLTDVPVAEYQEAVSKMLEKGVADMGLAGNTAMESTETITGSLAMLSSSWDNFLTGLFDESADMGMLGQRLFESLGAVIKNVVPRIGVLAGRAIMDLPQALMSAFMAIPGMIRPTLEAVFGEGIGGGIADMMESAFTSIQSIITDTMMPAAQVVVEFAQTVFTAITPVVQNIWSLIQQAFPIIQGIITAAMNFISNLMQTVWPIIGNIVSTVVGGISNVINQYWPAIQSLITSVMSAISSYVQTGWELISTVVSVAMNVINGIVTAVWPAIETIISTVMGVVLGVIQTVWPVISGIVETAVNVIKAAIDGISVVVGWVTDTFNAVKDAILGPIEAARDAVQGIIDAIVGFFDGLGNRITSAIGTITMPSISGSANVNGEQIAYVDIGWQAQGGILTNATLIGAGEAGAEAIIPLTNHQYVRPFAQTVAEEVNLMGGGEAMLIAWLSRNLGTIIADNAPSLSRRDFDRMARTAVAR